MLSKKAAVALFATLTMIAGGSISSAQADDYYYPDGTITMCIIKKDLRIRALKPGRVCGTKNEAEISWSSEGVVGETGEAGVDGVDRIDPALAIRQEARTCPTSSRWIR